MYSLFSPTSFATPTLSPTSSMPSRTSSTSSFNSTPNTPLTSPLIQRRTSPIVELEPLHHPYNLSTFAHSNMLHSNLIIDEPLEDSCPVCNEPLSLRLKGEKPRIAPLCGHKLHEACFEAVYGSVKRAKQHNSLVSGSLGLCGVCRREMKLNESNDALVNNKFAMISGLPNHVNNSTLDSHKLRSISKKTLIHDLPSLHDPNEDDALSSTPHYLTEVEIVQPRITVKSEIKQVIKSQEKDLKTFLTCLVTLDLPHRFNTSSTPSNDDGVQDDIPSPPPSQDPSTLNSPVLSNDQGLNQGYAFQPTPVASALKEHGLPDPFESVVKDLADRMVDWKGHTPSDFGKLKLYDYLHVAKDSNTREFLVYLFEEALLCVTDDTRKPSFAKSVIDSISGHSSSANPGQGDKLRLKGRVFIKHIKKLKNSSTLIPNFVNGVNLGNVEDWALSIIMGDDNLEGFILKFKEKSSLELWKSQIELLIHRDSLPPISTGNGTIKSKRSLNSVRDSVYSNDTTTHASTTSSHSRYTRTTAPSTVLSNVNSKDYQYTIPEEGFSQAGETDFHIKNKSTTTIRTITPFDGLVKMPTKPGLDLILCISLPCQTGPSASVLKLKLIRDSLAFIITNLGSKSRLSLIFYSVGKGKGTLRKTPLLSIGNREGLRRLNSIIEDLKNWEDEDSLINGLQNLDFRDEKVNVITAVNLAFDVILQRKMKNQLTGCMLLNDGKDGTPKVWLSSLFYDDHQIDSRRVQVQMDLCMVRAEAASIPIHTFGWGKSHDPSSLWLLSNHTGGTYTFVREWYQLRESLAGCLGGLLSIGIQSIKLHLNVPERKWFRIRKVAGVTGAIVSSDGKDVDVTLNELRYGEKREMLVEVEMSSFNLTTSPPSSRPSTGDQHPFGQPRSSSLSSSNSRSKNSLPPHMTGTDEFFLRKTGLNLSTLDDLNSNFYDDEYEDLMEDVPLFEVNASYKDSINGKIVSRLPLPILLTTTVLPPTSTNAPPPVPPPSDADVVRRRMELLVSDMLTRTLLLISRRNNNQALRIMVETRRIVETILSHLNDMITAPKELIKTVLLSMLEDIDFLIGGVEKDFDAVHRNFAAQQAVILRDQKAWSAKSGIEKLYCSADYATYLTKQSANWVGA